MSLLAQIEELEREIAAEGQQPSRLSKGRKQPPVPFDPGDETGDLSDDPERSDSPVQSTQKQPIPRGRASSEPIEVSSRFPEKYPQRSINPANSEEAQLQAKSAYEKGRAAANAQYAKPAPETKAPPFRGPREQAFLDDNDLSPLAGTVDRILQHPAGLAEWISGVQPTEEEKEAKRTQGVETLRQRELQRAYVQQADPEMVKKTREVLELLRTPGASSFHVVSAFKRLSPKEKEEVLLLAPGIAQQMGDDRGNIIGRAANTFWDGVKALALDPGNEIESDINAPGSPGFTPEDYEIARQFQSLVQQETGTRSSDPWYERMTLGAVNQAPYALPIGKATQIGSKVLPAVTKGFLSKNAAASIGGTIGSMAAAGPSSYVEEVHSLKEMGMEDGPALRAISALSGALTGGIERLNLSPFPTTKIKLTQGFSTAVRQRLIETARNYPGELTEEGLDALKSAAIQAGVSWADENIEDRSLRDVIVAGVTGIEDSALTMVGLTGGPAAFSLARNAGAIRQGTADFRELAMNMSPEEVQEREDRLAQLTGYKEASAKRVKELKGLLSKHKSQGLPKAVAAEAGIDIESVDEEGNVKPKTRTEIVKAIRGQIDVLEDTDVTDATDAEIEELQDLLNYRESLQKKGKIAPIQQPQVPEGGIDEVQQNDQQASSQANPFDGEAEAGEATEEVGVPAQEEIGSRQATEATSQTTAPAPTATAPPVVEPMVEEAELSGEDPAAERKRLRAARQKGAPGDTKAPEPTVPEATKDAEVPPAVESPQPAKTKFDAYVESAWGKKEPVSDSYRESQKQSINSISDYGIKMGRVIAFDRGDGSQELQFAAIAEELERRGYDVGPVRRSREGGVDNIEMSVAAKNPVPAAQEEANKEPTTQPPFAKTPEEIESLPTHSVYRSDFNGKPKFMVRGEGKRGGGDSMFDTQEEANKEAELAVSREKSRLEAKTKAAEKQAADQKAEEEHVASFQGFDAANPLKFGKARKSLEKQVNYQGKAQSRKQVVEQAVAEGAVVQNVVERAPLSNDRRKSLQQERLTESRNGRSPRFEELTQILDRGYEEVNTKRLVFPDERFLDEKAISSTGLRYAEHLAGLKKDPETADRDQFIARIKKNYGYKLTPREPKNADEQEQMDFLVSRGKKATFVDSDDRGFGGVVDHKTGHILIAGDRDTNDIWNAIGHELAHETGLDKIIPGDAAELSELKARRLQSTNNKFRKYLESNPEALDREARAEMVGQFMRDKGFRDQLARSNPTMWEAIRDAVLKLIGKWTPKNEAQALVLKELRQEKAPQVTETDQTGAKLDQTGAKSDQTGAKSDQTGAKSDQTGAKSDQTGAKSDQTGAAPGTPSEADFDAEAAKALDALDAQEKASKEKKPKSDGKPRAKRTGRKSDATKAEAQSDREAAKKAMAAAMAKLRGKVMMGVDPTIMAEIVQAAAMYVKADIKSFKGYVEALVEDFGDAWAKDFASYLESAWRVLHSRGRVDDPAGKIADFLTGEPKNEKQEESGAERDQRMGDGPGESQGDATATGDPVDGGRDAQGDPGQKGDALLPDSRKTEPDGGQRDSDGASADGDPDADQSDQGPTDATDSESGSDAGEMADRLAVNHVIAPDDDLAASGVVTSLNRNIKALELLKALETEGRFPDESERKALAQYTGWGGLSQALDSTKGERMLLEQSWGRDENWEKKWGKFYTQLKGLMSKEEFRAAQDSTENAHYTSKSVIQALWKIAERLGFNGGRVLELGAGVGHFAGLTPGRVRGATQFVMVEMDSISSRITKMLYPKHEVVSGDMQEFKTVPGSVTMGIGNVPFAPGSIPDAKARYGEELNLHNYSIARHLDAVAPGGIVVVISTHHTLDSRIKQRKFLATKGELIGAIRLPNDAFAENAKTEVVTDILIFRRPRQGDPSIGVRLDQNANITVKTKEGKEVEKSINKYFVDNPDMVLGVHSAKGSMRAADEYTVESTPGDLQEKLDAAISRLPMNILGKVDVSEQIVESTKNVPFGRLEVHNGKVVMGFGDNFVPIAGKTFEGFPSHLTGKTGVERAKDYVNLRESLTQVRKVMLSEDSTDADVKSEQQKLSKLYDGYVKKHGPLNSRKTNIFVRDPDYYRVLSLENEQGKYNPKTKKIDVTYEKSAIFETRVLGPRKEPQTADSTASAMSLSIAWRGAIDSAFIGKLLGVSSSDAENKLIEEGLAFRNPATTELDLADLYLSGNVRMKLAQAKLSAAEDAQYERNVEALTKVLPAEVPIRKDTVRLGATWVPEHIIQAFASKIFGTEASISYNSNSDSWTVEAYGISETAKARYKTDRVNPDKILEETLNLRSIKVYDRVETGEYDSRGKEKTTQVLNEKETQAAKHRASVMRADFEKWVMENEEVRQVLGAIYNDKYNNFVRTKYNGSALALPGANPTIKLRPYQMDAIWRIINRGTALLAHAVGSGKTFTMIGAAMEMRRLGLARRPLLVVQNATLGQFATSFQKMYPNANVLVASKGDLSAGNRQLFLNRVSTGNWDAVVMAQSTFDNMASDPEVERAFINDQIDLLEEAIREEGGEGAKTPTTKQLVRQRKSLKDRFDKLMGKRAKAGDNIVFEDLGADALFLDEAHAYKKPTFMTKLSSLVGLNTESSAKSLATTVKVRSIQAAHNGRNVILATGTPVTNTLGEAWHMVNYVSPATNEAFSSKTFDQFISNFAMVEPTLTMNAGGQYVYKDAIVKFRNGQQLVEYINDNWDIVTPDALRAYMSGKNESLPELRDGKLTAITVDRTPGVSEFMQFIESVYARFKSLPAKERRELSFIPAIAYGASKAATLDIRLVNPNAKEEPNSKLQRAAKEIKRIYDETSETKGTQLFFSDIKNPFSMTRLRQFMGGQVIDAFEEDTVADGQDADADTQNEVKEEDSFLYQELKRKLLESGIPAEQIALISDAKTDKQRESLFERVQSGDIRVLIGSTSKMGVGVNVQNKLAAIHHFDTPWLPADLEQREGRIIRFGNENKVVEILRYAMKKTLDGAIYMATSRKQKFIWQVLNGQLDGDSFDDPSSAAMLSIEEQLAAIQDDPIFFEKIETQNRLRELEMERQSFYDAQQRSRSTLNQYQSSLDYTKESSIHTRIQQFEEYKAAGIFDNFSLTIDGKTFTDAKEAAEIIKVKAEGIRKYVMENHDTAKSLSHIAGINDLNKNQIIQFQIGPAEITIGASPSVTDEINAEGNVVRTKSVSLKSEALIPSGLGRLYPFYSGTAVLPQTIFEKMGPLLEQSKDDLRAELNRVNFYTKSIEELKTLVDRQWEDQAEYDQKKERLSEIEQIMLASKSSLSSETKKEDEGELEKELRNRPPDPDILFQREEPGLMEQATNVVLDAEDLGLATYDELIAFAVKSIGERQTRFLGKYLQEAAKAGGMKGVRPTKEILGVPGVTKSEAVTFAKAAFPMLTDEMVETGMEMVDATAFGLEEIGFAPAGTPVPSGRMTQSGDQTNTPEFKRWFGDSKVVDADGKPLVVYHGTDADQPFNEFHSGQHFGGKVSANQRVSFRGGKDNSRIYPVYLSIKNPIRLSDRAAVDEASLLNAIIRGEVPGASVNVARKSGAYEAAKQAGYDGIVYRNLIEDAGKDSYVAFDPAQIKSATGNQGTFDPSDPSILKQNQEQNGNVKGWTKFISATRAIIGATDKADFSTFIHEFFHPMRRFLLDRSVPLDKRKGITDEDIQALEDYAGVKDGKWTVAAEEKAAKAWEQYWLEGWTGKLPAALQPLFEKIARWMRDVYQGVQQITGGQLTPEVRALFDKIVQRGFPDGFQMPPPHQGPGAPPVGSESHPEKLERIFPSRYEYTAMGKGVMNYLRELSNVPGLESNTKETVEGWVQQAEITLAADPYAAERLYRDVAASGGRPLDQHEVTLLAFHYRKLANDSEAAFQETVAAAESGDPARIAQARTDFIRTRQPMTEFEELTYASKSAMGRAFFALQVMLRQDFTTGGLMKRAQQANHGNPLSKEQKDEMQALADEIDKLQKEVDRLRAKYDREEAETESKKQDDQARKDTKPRPKASPPQKTTLETAWDAFKSFTGIDTLFQQDGPYSGIAQAYRDMGVTTFAELMRHVQERIGKAKAKELKTEFRAAWKSTEPDADLTGAFDRGNDRDMTKLARQIQRQLIEGGFTDRLEVIEAVREEMSGILESEVTTVQAMDWLSGYGQYSTPSQGEIDKLIRTHNSETLKHRQILQLEEALARAEQIRTADPNMTEEQIGDQLVAEGLLVKPTGPQRDQAWPELRKMQREYNDLKSQVPVSSEGRAGMLQTRLGTIQRGLANRIVDLKEAIASGERINNERKPSPSNDETDRLREELAGLTKTYREMFPKKPMTDEQRIKNAIRAAERSIADMEKQIATHNFGKPKSLKVSSPALEALEAQKASLRAQIDALKSLDPSVQEQREAAIRKNYIASIERRIAEYHRILAEKDFKKKVKVDRKLSPEELVAQNRLREAGQKVLEAFAKYHVANLKGLAKFLDTAAELSHLSRAMMTSLDLSALLNQGALMALSHPKLTARVLREVAQILKSQFDRGKLLNRENLSLEKIEDFLTGIDTRQAEFNHMQMLTTGEDGEFKLKVGLALTASDQDLTKQDEAFQGRWAKYWPGVAISGRVYVMLVNGLRSAMFDALANGLYIGGRQMTLEEGKLLASFVNVTTGRSDLKGIPILEKLEKHSAFLNTVFFAARFVAARFQYLAMPFYLPFAGGGVSKAWDVKKAIYVEMMRTTGSYMAVLGAVSLLSTMFWDDDDEERPTIGTDPTTSDFGKVKFGDTRIDFGGGILQSMVFLSRFGLGRQGDTQFGDQPMTRATLVGDFIRTKLAPVPGFIWTGLDGWKDPVGNVQDELLGFKVHPSIGTGVRLFVPLTTQNMYDVVADHGLAGLPLAAMSFLGVRISTYGPKTKYTYGTPDERQKQLDDYVKYMTWDSPDPEFKEFLTPEEFEKVQLRRENRKQSLVNEALHDPQRADFETEENYEKAVARRDAAIASAKEAGWSSAEIRQLLLDHWKSNNGSPRHLRDGVYVLKDQVRDRIRRINKVFGGVPGAE